ncbi:MAG: L,D-transpeptidase [Bdellovibrionota bacterium]
MQDSMLMTNISTKIRNVICAVIVLSMFSACSQLGGSDYLESGTIIISHQVPEHSSGVASATPLTGTPELAPVFAPLLGYFPPAVTYLPADNETWLEIDHASHMLTLYKGKNVIKEMQGEGDVAIAPGDYYLQHKQKQPKWYAPNNYFAKRQLTIPAPDDSLRYRRGALGKFALFPTTTFPIHCAPIWTEDVGGLRVSATDLSSIYYMLPIGAPIVVK